MTSAHWPKPASIDETIDTIADAGTEDPTEQVKLGKFPAQYTRSWNRAHILRYGENPHQDAALYVDPLNVRGFADAEQLGGKPMSYNNYVDADAAWRAVWDFAPRSPSPWSSTTTRADWPWEPPSPKHTARHMPAIQ